MKTKLAAVSAIALLTSQAFSWDLQAEWSDVNNPNGPWKLEKSPGSLFTIQQGDYWQNGSNQKAWADEPFNLNAHVPFWMKVTDITAYSGADILLGDIAAHTPEIDRTGFETTVLTWTSPVAGVMNIGGGVWFPFQRGRHVTLELRHNNTTLYNSILPGNGTWTRSNPYGLGHQRNFAVGDLLELRLTSSNVNLGEIVGVNLSVNPVPEPATMLALAAGAAVLLRRRRAARQ